MKLKFRTGESRRTSHLRRFSGVIAAAGVATLLLSSCSADVEAEVPAETPEAPAEVVAEPMIPEGKIVIWEHANAANQAYFEPKYAEYEEATGVEIEVLYIPIADLETKLQTAFGAGNPPDIIKVGAWQMTPMVERGNLAPVDFVNFGAGSEEGFESYFEEGGLGAVTFNETVYGVPTDFNSVSLWYRKDLFEAAGLDPESPPTTWEQVAEYSEVLTKSDGSQVGLQTTRAGSPIWSQMVMQTLVEGLGGSILTQDGKSGALNTPQGIQALEYYAQMGNPTFESPSFGFSMFADGNAAMLLGGRFMDGFMQSLNPDLVYGENFESVEVPSWEGRSKVAAGYSWGWAVTEASDNQHTAWNLIGWLNDRDRLDEQLGATGLVTPVADWTSLSNAQSGASIVMQSQLPYTGYGVPTANWNEIMTALSEILEAVQLQTLAPAEAAEEFDARVASITG
jgi:ABC-type glycerol-3-phosphate transport system substrate-binding protein